MTTQRPTAYRHLAWTPFGSATVSSYQVSGQFSKQPVSTSVTKGWFEVIARERSDRSNPAPMLDSTLSNSYRTELRFSDRIPARPKDRQ